MAPGDVCHGPRCSLAALGQVALGTAPAPGLVGWPGRPGVSNPWGVGSFLSLGRSTCARCLGPLGCWSPVCLRGLLCCICGVMGHLAFVHRSARSVWCVACAASRAPWLPFTGVPAGCVVLCVRCPRPVGSCSPVRLLGVLLCVRGVLGHFTPVRRCALYVFCFVCVMSWATCLLFTGVPARFVVLCLRCLGRLGSCSPVCVLCVLCCVCHVLGPLAPVHRCVRLVCCVACAVSWATWLLFTGVPALPLVLFVRCPGPLGSCSQVCPLGVLFCVCGVLGLLAPVHRYAWLLCPVPLFPSVHPRGRCPGPRGTRSPVCGLCAVRVCCWWLCPSSSPTNFRFFPFFFEVEEKKTGARVHCRHRHGQLVQRCNFVVSSGVCCRYFDGGRAPGMRLARPDVHGYGSGWVWLAASLLVVLAG